MTDTPDRDTASDLAARRGLDTDVYPPSEDSALLATAVVDRLTSEDLVLEVGTGSGWIAARIVESTGATVIGSDLNPHACRAAGERGIPVVRGNLLEPFADDRFDAVVFNPPYLPTDPDHEWDDWMEAALSGGPDGRRLVTPFLAALDRVLAPEGRGYLLVSSLTDRDAVEAIAADNGLEANAIAEESYPFETLFVLELTRAGV